MSILAIFSKGSIPLGLAFLLLSLSPGNAVMLVQRRQVQVSVCISGKMRNKNRLALGE